MKNRHGVCEQFTKKAEAVSAMVTTVDCMDDAYKYLMALCETKDHCLNLIPESPRPSVINGQQDANVKAQKIIAAPSLEKDVRLNLSRLCLENGFHLIEKNLRKYGGGVDIGFTYADAGIAETGTLMIDSSSEELRLATMLSEFHVCVLPKSRIVADSYDAEEKLVQGMTKNANYTAFITGASRTADIERVLALGVHGPLELHILLLED